MDAGNWLRVGRGLFRLADWVPDQHDELARWTLWSKGRAVVSHETALSVHAIGEFESAKVHLTVPPGFTMRDPAVILHRAELPEADVVQRTSFKLTTVVRSLVDIAAGTPDRDQLARAIEEATKRRGHCEWRSNSACSPSLKPRASASIACGVGCSSSASSRGSRPPLLTAGS